jgi:uncharacterized coiled-coil protein SlyX
MNTDRLARYVAELRRKLSKAQHKVSVLLGELSRAEERHRLAVDSSKIEASKRG